MIKILVTGANGFVGSHVLQTLMTIKHDDLKIVAACRNPAKLHPSYRGEVRVGDLRDPDYLDRLLVNVDVICHTAGWSSFIAEPDKSNQLYLEPTLDLINHAIEWRVSRFINLSSLAAAAPHQRHDSMAMGKPRRYWPMMNCLIAVENYMQAHAQIGCTMVNLRTGIYSGQGMNIGLLPLLINRLSTTRLAYTSGRYGFFPMIDGKDIGQAFVRAALAPELNPYESFNITGPDQPASADVIEFLKQQIAHHKTTLSMPALACHGYSWLQEYLSNDTKQASFSRSLSDLMANPLINGDSSRIKLGYDPEISWQASLHTLCEDQLKQQLPASLTATARPLNLIE